MDHLAYPHIMEAIIAVASYDSLISLRGASSAMRMRVDPLLAQHMRVHLPEATGHEMEGPLLITYGASVPLARYPSTSASASTSPSAPISPVSFPSAEVHSTKLKPHADALAAAKVIDIMSPTSHYRLWRLYPLLDGVKTVRYHGPDLYTSAYADATVSVRHIVDQFLIPLRATRIIVSLDVDTPRQIRQIAFPVLRWCRKAVINVWWSPAVPELSAPHRCNLVVDAGIKDLVFLCRRKDVMGGSTAPPLSSASAPSKASDTPRAPQEMGMFRNILKYEFNRILTPGWTKVVTFVGLEAVEPPALGYVDAEPTPAQIIDDMFSFILDEGIGGDPPEDYDSARALLRERVRFLSHKEYEAEIGWREYELETMPHPK